MTLPAWVHDTPNGALLDLHIAPRASRTQPCGEHDGRLKLQVAAPPVDGAANKEIVAFLAKLLGVGRSAVNIVAGDTGKRKRVLIEGLTAAEVAAKL